MSLAGQAFTKMSGSGNDFIFLDATEIDLLPMLPPAVVTALCARGTGVGADGIVTIQRSVHADYQMVYLNSDGSRADLCGNATLCSVRMAERLGLVGEGEVRVETDSGVLEARLLKGVAEVELPVVSDLRKDMPFRRERDERWIGFALTGVPHLVVRVEDVATVDVTGRGRPLRRDPSLPYGANVNFVSPSTDGSAGWMIRTYERGVEAETLACGTGSVSSAILLHEHGEVAATVSLRTRSGREHRVGLRRVAEGWVPSLSGDARFVFEGVIGEGGGF